MVNGGHLIVVRRVSLHGVSHEEGLRTGRDEGVTRSHNLKAQETEGTHQGSSVLSVLVEADEHVVSLQLLLRKLQQKRQTVLASLGERAGEDLDVEVPPFQRHPPDTLLTLSAAGLKVKEAHPAVGGKELLQNQQLSVRVEKRCRKIAIPLIIPSPTWDLQGWVRGIRNTTEAPDRGDCCGGGTSGDWRCSHSRR